MRYIICVLLLSACSWDARVTQLDVSLRLLKDKEPTPTLNIKSGEQGTLKKTHSNPVYENKEYEEIKDKEELQKSE